MARLLTKSKDKEEKRKKGKKTRGVEKNGSGGSDWHRQKNKITKRPKYYWHQWRKTWKERRVEKHGSVGGAWHWGVGVRDEQRTTVHQLFPPAFLFFSCFPLSRFIKWWLSPNSLPQLLIFFWDCWLSKQHDGRVWLLVVGAVSQGHRAIRAKGLHRKYFCWDLHTLLFNIISSILFS